MTPVTTNHPIRLHVILNPLDRYKREGAKSKKKKQVAAQIVRLKEKKCRWAKDERRRKQNNNMTKSISILRENAGALITILCITA